MRLVFAFVALSLVLLASVSAIPFAHVATHHHVVDSFESYKIPAAKQDLDENNSAISDLNERVARLEEDDDDDDNTANLDIDCVTWNVGNDVPTQAELQNFFTTTGAGALAAHIVVVGVQESTFGADGNNFLPILTAAAHAEGFAFITSYGVGESTDNALRTQISAWSNNNRAVAAGIVAENLLRFDKKTGIAGTSLKGGAGIVLLVDDVRLAFVAAHLAAHMPYMFDRNSDIEEILKASNKVHDHLDMSFTADHMFWMGDLNYRLDPAREVTMRTNPAYKYSDLQSVLWLTHKDNRMSTHANNNIAVLGQIGNAHNLIQFDQLSIQRDVMHRIFAETWLEPQIAFRPTFKVSLGAVEAYQASRVPSYCDRVLFNSLPGVAGNVAVNHYARIAAVTTSDHKAVVAGFRLQLITPPVPAAATAQTVTLDIDFSTVVFDVNTRAQDLYIQTVLAQGRTFFVRVVSHPADIIFPASSDFDMDVGSVAAHAVQIRGAVVNIATNAMTSTAHIIVTLFKRNNKIGMKNLGSFAIHLGGLIAHAPALTVGHLTRNGASALNGSGKHRGEPSSQSLLGTRHSYQATATLS